MGAENDVSPGRAKEIGARIVQARKEMGGMRQEELAELIHVSTRSMQAYESGEVVPYRKLKDLERVLGRSMSWILHGEAGEARDQQLDELRDLIAGNQSVLDQLAKSALKRDELLGQILEAIRDLKPTAA